MNRRHTHEPRHTHTRAPVTRARKRACMSSICVDIEGDTQCVHCHTLPGTRIPHMPNSAQVLLDKGVAYENTFQDKQISTLKSSSELHMPLGATQYLPHYRL